MNWLELELELELELRAASFNHWVIWGPIGAPCLGFANFYQLPLHHVEALDILMRTIL